MPLDSEISIRIFKDVPDLPATQPINFVRTDAPPFLLLHGADDTTCLPKNSINLLRRMQAVGAPGQLKLYEGVSHVDIMLAFAKPLRNRVSTLNDIMAFFAKQN